jgi:hypothetical protein
VQLVNRPALPTALRVATLMLDALPLPWEGRTMLYRSDLDRHCD